MEYPHIVKFSGGRSSGMMLLHLLKEGQLNPMRGDAIVFNNTSAEHPETYNFTRKIKKLAEKEFNIPFFWIEFQTFEDASDHGTWVRKPTYRIVNDQPRSKGNPAGYHHSGEVFEEMISTNGYVPNMLSRNCTLFMKIFVTNAFLTNWFAMNSGISRCGHNGETSRMTDQMVISDHRRAGGRVPDEILLEKKYYVRQCPHYRPAQNWQDFTSANIVFDNPLLKKNILGGKAELYGSHAANYYSYLGIRSDEKHRAEKIRARVAASAKGKTRSLFQQPPGEIILTPLVDSGVDQQGVLSFWIEQEFDLNLPLNGLYSNCLFCPLKGKKKLVRIAREELASEKFTPVSIDWWAGMEEKYSRDLIAEERSITNTEVTTVGFFGASSMKTYAALKEEAETGIDVDCDAEYLVNEDYSVCQCTD
ncbi:MAG: hypothetical protein F4X92_00095 [Gammaproteobacteria bacterium]|nr:hypothetical protein [Gammaproteobacteria bacterium]